MRYVSFLRPDGRAAFGSIAGQEVIDLASRSATPANLKTAIALDMLHKLESGPCYRLADLKLLPVIPAPGKILCVGLNYETHRKETGRAEALHPAIFTRFADSLVAHGQPILKPRASEELDYEGELAIVIGKAGRAIRREAALEHIAGYSCFNDASIRDWQRHNIQFTPGKNFPSTGAFGPALVTPNEIGDPRKLRVTTRLNGVVVQDQPVADMIWPIEEIIEYISAFTRLAAGDVIATGTPGGVGSKRTPPLWMKPGDQVEVDIGAVGKLVNSVGSE